MARESNERIAEQASKDRTAALITNSVLQFSNMALQGALKSWELSRDPADVRSQVAQAEILQEKAAELEGSIDMSELGPPAGDTPEGAPTAPPGTTVGPPTAAAPTREPIVMPQAALDMLLTEMPRISAEFADGSAGRANLKAQLLKLPEVSDEAHAERLISSFINQGEFLQKNHQAMIDSGALKMAEGEGFPFWNAIASSMRKDQKWAQQYGVGQALAGRAGPAGGGVEGRPTENYMAKLAAVRQKVGDEALLAQVVDKVVSDPSAGPAVIEEAAEVNPGHDWRAIAEAAKKGDRGPAIDALMDTLNMTPEQLRAATSVEGLDRAMSFFGPDGEPRIARTDSVRDLKDAVHALEAAGRDELAAKLLRKEAWGRTHDWKSVVPSKLASRPEAGVGAYLDEGEAKLGMDPRARAKAMYDLALGEGELKTKELTAKAKLARATRNVTRGSHANHKGRTNNLSEEDWKASWRDRPEYKRILDMVGEEEAEDLLHRQWRNKKKSLLYKRYVELGKVAKEEAAPEQEAAEAAKKAETDAKKANRDRLTKKRQFEKDVRDRKADLRKALSKWGVSPGGKVTTDKWVNKRLREENVSTGQRKRRKKELLREAQAGVSAANSEIAAALQAVQDAEQAKKDFLATFED